MENLIIIRGPLGIGKTTVSKELASRLGAVYISIDEELSKHNLLTESDIPVENFIKLNDLIVPFIKEKMENGQDVVIDGNFYFMQQIENLLNKINVSHFVFTLKAPLSICVDRDSMREKPLGRESAEAVYRLVSGFDYGIVINTGDLSSDEVVSKINSYLN